MGLFDFFRRKPAEDPAPAPSEASARLPKQGTPVPLEQTSYDIAYRILPEYAYQHLDRIVEMVTTSPNAARPFYYVMACLARGFEPDTANALRYRWHTGELDGRNYLALEYPEPPPIDMGDKDPIEIFQSGVRIVLAPFFSVILYGGGKAPQYFILGQAPIGGGTTVRAVTPEGANCNLGPGPEPKLELFFEVIRQRLSGRA